MLKSLVIVGVLFLGCNFARPQVAGNGRKQEQSTQTGQAQGQSAPVPQVPKGSTEQKQNAQAKRYQWRELYAPANVPNWLLAVVALWAGIMALKTLKAINRQADLMKTQSDIQAAGMRQWVDIKAKPETSTGNIAGGKNYEVQLEFEAINNTAYVLTVEKIRTAVGMEADTWEIFTVETDIDLSPRKESDSNVYSFYVPAQTIKKEWFERGTVVTIDGQITFRDCLGKVRTDHFGGLYDCSPKGFIKIRQLGIVPDRKQVYARNPNEPT